MPCMCSLSCQSKFGFVKSLILASIFVYHYSILCIWLLHCKNWSVLRTPIYAPIQTPLMASILEYFGVLRTLQFLQCIISLLCMHTCCICFYICILAWLYDSCDFIPLVCKSFCVWRPFALSILFTITDHTALRNGLSHKLARR